MLKIIKQEKLIKKNDNYFLKYIIKCIAYIHIKKKKIISTKFYLIIHV